MPRITAAEYRALAKPEKSGRYGKNKRVDTPDGVFDSKGEYSRFAFLQLMQKHRDISDLRRQVPFAFSHNGVLICVYIADFIYDYCGRVVVEDWKGRIITPEFKIKRNLMKAFHGIEIKTVTRARASLE